MKKFLLGSLSLLDQHNDTSLLVSSLNQPTFKNLTLADDSVFSQSHPDQAKSSQDHPHFLGKLTGEDHRH